MKEKLCLLINVTRDPRVHQIIERTIVSKKSVANKFERSYSTSPAEFLESASTADIIFSFGIPENVLQKAQAVRWIHFASAGIDRSFSPALANHPAKITCSRGIHAVTIAEYILMMILALSKNLKQAIRYQHKNEWQFENLLQSKFDLKDKTIAIIGLGSIGSQVAKLAKAFGMKVIGTVSESRKVRYVDKVFPAFKLDQCLKQADFVTLCLPLTEKTQHLIAEKQLSAMKKSAFLINIGRGKLIDENALIAALQNHQIAGAALYVFEQEPLPASSPLWQMENVYITPHYSGMAENLWEKVAELFCDNATRFLNGKRMLGMIDRKKGY